MLLRAGGLPQTIQLNVMLHEAPIVSAQRTLS